MKRPREYQISSLFSREARSTNLWLYFLLALIPWIGLPSLHGSSEAREGQVVSVMLRSGEWILPLRNGIIPSKPPLYHWLASLVSMICGGVSPFSLRLTALFAGAAMIALTGWFVGRFSQGLKSHNQRYSPGLCAGFIAATSYLCISLACSARVDMVFSLCCTAAIFFGIDAYVLNEQKGRYSALGFFVFLGLAILAKGPLGAALPGIIVLVMVLVPERGGAGKDARFLKLKKFLTPSFLWMVPLLIALPWYGLAAAKGGMPFISRQILFENVERITGGEDMNSEVFWFYLPAMLRTLFPWSLIFWGLLIRDLLLLKQKKVSFQPYHFGLIWFFTGFILFSFASGKRPSYLLPLLPGLAWYVSGAGQKCWQDFQERRKEDPIPNSMRFLQALGSFFQHENRLKISLSLFLFVSFMIVEVVCSVPLITNPVQIEAVRWVKQYSIWFEILFLVPILFLGISSRLHGYVLEGCFFSVVVLVGGWIHIGLGIKGHMKGFERMSNRISSVVGSSALTVLKSPEDEYFDPLFYYLGREVSIAPQTSHLCPSTGFFLTRSSAFLGHFQTETPILKFQEEMGERGKLLKGDDGSTLTLYECP